MKVGSYVQRRQLQKVCQTFHAQHYGNSDGRLWFNDLKMNYYSLAKGKHRINAVMKSVLYE